VQLVRFWIGKRCLPSLPSFIENAGKNAFTPNFGPTPTQTSIQLLKVDSVFDTVTPLKSLKTSTSTSKICTQPEKSFWNTKTNKTSCAVRARSWDMIPCKEK